MANNRNKLVDSNTNYTKRTDGFDHCEILNASNEGPSTSESYKFFHRILKYLMRFTARIQNTRKKFNTRSSVGGTPCKSEEKIVACTSLSSIVGNRIKSDAGAVARMKQKMIDAIASTTRSGEVLDKVPHENLPCEIVKHFVYGASYRCTRYAAKYVDNTVPQRGCGPLCIGIATQSDIADGEFSLETSPDAFAKACEKRRHVDSILGEITKVLDSLMKRARRGSAKEQASAISRSVSLTRYEMREEAFENMKPLISSVIHAEEKPAAAAAAATTSVMQPETQVLVSCTSHFPPDSRDFSADLDKSLDASNIQCREDEHTCLILITCPERDDLEDSVITVAARKNKKEEDESLKKTSLEPTVDEHVFDDETSYDAVNSIITQGVPKLRENNSKTIDLYRPNDIQIDTTDALRHEAITAKNDIIESPIETSQVVKEPAQRAEDILQESMPYKKPKYRAKYRDDTSRTTKGEKISQFNKIPKTCDKIPKYSLSLPSRAYQMINTSRFFNYFERPVTGMYQNCPSIPSRYPLPTRFNTGEDLIRSNIYLGEYCDVCTIPCFSSRNEAIRNATFSHSHCHLPQDSCATEYRASCHSLVDSHTSSRYCNIDADFVHGVTFGNSLCAYYRGCAKYCYPRPNNIDGIRMGHYHCSDSCPVRNDNQHCGRDRSYYWTKEHLYFTRPWSICCDIIDIDNGNM